MMSGHTHKGILPFKCNIIQGGQELNQGLEVTEPQPGLQCLWWQGCGGGVLWDETISCTCIEMRLRGSFDKLPETKAL
jgi:hypothetical protein